MKGWQFWTTVGLSALCLVGTGTLMVLGRANQALQVEVARQQDVINKGGLSQQLGNSLLRDVAAAAQKNQNMRNILVKNGYIDPQPVPQPTTNGKGGAK